MPTRNPRFWLEMLILGFLLVFGMATLSAWLSSPWVNLARIGFAAVLVGGYASYYDRKWGRTK